MNVRLNPRLIPAEVWSITHSLSSEYPMNKGRESEIGCPLLAESGQVAAASFARSGLWSTCLANRRLLWSAHSTDYAMQREHGPMNIKKGAASLCFYMAAEMRK